MLVIHDLDVLFILPANNRETVSSAIPVWQFVTVAAKVMIAEQQSGSIEPGKNADMILFAQNPLQYIGVIRDVRLVIKGDRYFIPAQLYKAVGIKPFN